MDCYYLKEHLYQILSSYTFKCHSHEDTTLLPWQQILQWIAIAPRDVCTKSEV